jgi:hypothetical protein
MYRDLPPTFPPRNPHTTQKHRKEVFWQITIPLAIGLIIVLAMAVGVTFASAPQASRLADISLIWLILPTMIIFLVFLVLTAGLAYGVIWLIGNLPPLAFRAHKFLIQLSVTVRKLSDKSVEPILRVESLKASLRAARRRL